MHSCTARESGALPKNPQIVLMAISTPTFGASAVGTWSAVKTTNKYLDVDLSPPNRLREWHEAQFPAWTLSWPADLRSSSMRRCQPRSLSLRLPHARGFSSSSSVSLTCFFCGLPPLTTYFLAALEGGRLCINMPYRRASTLSYGARSKTSVPMLPLEAGIGKKRTIRRLSCRADEKLQV